MQDHFWSGWVCNRNTRYSSTKPRARAHTHARVLRVRQARSHTFSCGGGAEIVLRARWMNTNWMITLLTHAHERLTTHPCLRSPGSRRRGDTGGKDHCWHLKAKFAFSRALWSTQSTLISAQTRLISVNRPRPVRMARAHARPVPVRMRGPCAWHVHARVPHPPLSPAARKEHGDATQGELLQLRAHLGAPTKSVLASTPHVLRIVLDVFGMRIVMTILGVKKARSHISAARPTWFCA